MMWTSKCLEKQAIQLETSKQSIYIAYISMNPVPQKHLYISFES